MTKTKYYYVSGLCPAWHLNGQWPVKYTSENNESFRKSEMACEALSTGKCTCSDRCPIFESANDLIPASDYLLYDKKIGS